jgi:hypothetical protein
MESSKKIPKGQVGDFISDSTETALALKQDTLVSGTNIKTLNGQSILGSGNIVISGGGSSNFNFNFSFSGQSDYKVYQGVLVTDTNIYTCSDRDTVFGFQNSISKFDRNGIFISEFLNSYTSLDPQGKFMSYGSMYDDGSYFLICAYNINSGGSPRISRIVRHNRITLAFVDEFDIGDGVAENITLYNGDYYVCYHNAMIVRKFNTSFVLITEYNLSRATGPNGGYQSIFVIGNMFYFNYHGPDALGGTYSIGMDKYLFDGNTFHYQSNIVAPTYGSGQGVIHFDHKFYWVDRVENSIVVTDNLEEQIIDYKPVKIDTGLTVLSLANPEGTFYGMTTPKTSLTYTLATKITLNGFARVLINAASNVSVTGATKIKGSAFIASTNMYMTVWYNGNRAEYWFEEI